MYKQKTLLLLSLFVGTTQATESATQPSDPHAVALATFAEVLDSAVASVTTAHDIFKAALEATKAKANGIARDAANDIGRDTVFHALDQSMDDIASASRARREVVRAAQEAIKDAQSVAEATVGAEAARSFRLTHPSRRHLDRYIIKATHAELSAQEALCKFIDQLNSNTRDLLARHDQGQSRLLDATPYRVW